MASTLLTSPTDSGPSYDREKELARIAERYEYLPTLLAQTLPRVLADQDIRATLIELRSQGWLDWQLLLAIHNIAMNARVGYEGIDPAGSTKAERDRVLAVVTRPETDGSPPIPLEFFNRTAFDSQLLVNTVGILNRFQLQSHPQTPPFQAILAVLRTRYGHDSDDVPHADLLPAP